MKNLVIAYETVNRIMTCVKSVVEADACISLELGTGVRKGQGNVADAMISKVSVTNGSEQVELAIVTACPEQLPDGISPSSPAEKVFLKAQDFLGALEALAVYKSQFVVDVDDDKIIITAGSASVPVYKVAEETMKAVVPHMMNCSNPSLWDTYLLNIRVKAADLLSAVKSTGVIAKMVDKLEKFGYFNVAVCDAEEVKQDVEVNGTTRSITVTNSKMKLVTTDGVSFAAGTVPVLSIKGMVPEQVKQLMQQMPEEDRAGFKDKVHPVVEFSRDEASGHLKTTVTEFDDYKKEYDENRKIKSGWFQFGVSITGMDKMQRLASSVSPDSYIEITVGKRYMLVNVVELSVIYLCTQRPIMATSFEDTFTSVANEIHKAGCRITVDAAQISNALRITNLYAKDALVGSFPLSLTIKKDGLDVTREEAHVTIPVISSETKMERAECGIYSNYLAVVPAALPAGSVDIYHCNMGGGTCFMFSRSGIAAEDLMNNGLLVGGVTDAQEAIENIKRRYEEKKKKLEEKKKN